MTVVGARWRGFVRLLRNSDFVTGVRITLGIFPRRHGFIWHCVSVSVLNRSGRNKMTTYKIVRFYFRGERRVLRRGLTLEQAQAHCRNPETSSETCKKWRNRKRTREMGPWFDGYEEEK